MTLWIQNRDAGSGRGLSPPLFHAGAIGYAQELQSTGWEIKQRDRVHAGAVQGPGIDEAAAVLGVLLVVVGVPVEDVVVRTAVECPFELALVAVKDSDPSAVDLDTHRDRRPRQTQGGDIL